MAEEVELLAPEKALGVLGVELPAAEDLKHLRDVEQVLFQRRGVHQAIVHINERAPAQGGRGPRKATRSPRDEKPAVGGNPPPGSRPELSKSLQRHLV